MYTVIGIGGVGCRVAQGFSQHPQYDVLCIDDEPTGWRDELVLNKSKTPEEYENSFAGLSKTVLNNIKEDVIVVLTGASLVTAVSLRMLQQIKDKNITILYVRPERDLMDDIKSSQEKIIFSVMQEYARSGLFKRIYLTSNEQMDKLVEDASIKEYYPTINSLIVSVFHMIMVFDHSQSLVSNFSELNQARRICTLGILNMEEGSEAKFFPFSDAMDTRLYYGISKDTLSSDKNLQRNIIKLIKQKNKELCKYSYGVYETQYEQDFCYTKYFSSKVQEF